MLNQKLRKQWIRALRSNKYKQGKYFLRDEADNYCCLGVLCDVADNTKWDIRKTTESAHCYLGHGIKTITSSLLNSVTALDRDFLTALNDSGDKTFDEIADHIALNAEHVRYRVKPKSGMYLTDSGGYSKNFRNARVFKDKKTAKMFGKPVPFGVKNDKI